MTAPVPIAVVTTGGTIDKLYFDSLSEYQVGESVVRKLLATANVKYPFDVIEALRKDSLEMTDEDREDLYGWRRRGESGRATAARPAAPWKTVSSAAGRLT